MQALAGVLGHHEIIGSIARTIDEGTEINVLQGPPGVGKSWLANGLGALWEEGGGRAIVAQGDQLQSDAPYYPLSLALAALGRAWSAVGKDLAQVTKAGERMAGTAGVVTGTAQALSRLRPARQRARKRYLNDVEQGILFELARLARKRPLLLIADNLHWWDTRSLEFLGRLREPAMSDAFPFLTNLRVLAVQTIEPYQQTAHPLARDALLARGRTQWHDVKRVPRTAFPAVFEALGAPAGTPAATADRVYDLTGGHLALAARCAQRVRDDGGADLLAAATGDEFVRRLLTDRISSLGSVGTATLAILQIAAVLGLRFRRTEVICAFEGEAAEAARLLRTCRDEDILDLSEDMGQFAHDVFRQHFLTAGGRETTGIHESVSQCLRLLRPGAYELRCAHAQRAEQNREAAAFGVQAALELQREGRPWREIAPHVLSAIETCDMVGVVELFSTALTQFHQTDFAGCNATLDRLPHSLPRRLNAEADYLRATCLADTRSTVDREEAVALLEQWAGYEAEEPELGVRMMHARLFALSLRVDKAPGRALEGQIRQALLQRGDFDQAAHDAMYTLDRCAGALYEPDVALIRTREAAQHFGPSEADSLVRRPGEYFRCLVNLGAMLVLSARYDEAREVHARMDALVADYAPGAFPRLDWSRSNVVLADYRADAIDAAEAVRRQRQVVTDHRVPADPFYVENALAVYLTLAGEGAEALTILDRLLEQLDRMERPEASTRYLIAANRSATRYVLGEHETAATEWAELSDLVAQIPYTIGKYQVARHELLEPILRSGLAMTALELDECLLGTARFGPLWDQLGRAFRLPEVEWWH
ncbi:AAA family ATPase [Solirubrobacter phytolaccae]|uniref:AAA family ATPase n=1 Tax=Solirubrobacter phytolaccae TaxID=1404360 RepID=A0A9X3NGL3_9ACTN|nr:AAA family ATPase [Solirubrobacter phytolaccae]MDA0185761.1 AAA family ATPase [Solirubrobacter phytolaccae]